MSEAFYCYTYFDPSRGELIYVGKGKGGRATSHLKSRANTPFVSRLKHMKTNGVAPEISYLCKDVDEELAILCEEEAISKYGRKDLGKGALLNLTDGGEGVSGYRHTESAKARISASMTGTKRPDLSLALRGQKRTEATRSLMSQKQKGRCFSEEHKLNLREAFAKKRREKQENLIGGVHTE